MKLARKQIIEQLGEKGADIPALVARIVRSPVTVATLVDALQVETRPLRYAYEKALRLVSERKPALLYPRFDVFVGLLASDNSFLKWGAIMTLANLTPVDVDGKFEAIFKAYYAPIKGPTMITANNIIGSSVTIAKAKPELTPRIVREILKVEKGRYKRKGSPSPECRNVAIGQAIDTFNQLFDQIEDQPAVIRFVKRQLKNSRPKVVKKAETFLRRNGK